MPGGSSTSDPQRQSPWSRPAVLLSGAFLLGLIFAGLLVAFSGDRGARRVTRTPPKQAAAAPTTPTSRPVSSAACTLAPGGQALPATSPPAGTSWSTVGSMQVPQAPRLYGPARTNGAFNTCFAHSPAGALLAAINLWAEGTAADPAQVFGRLAVGAPQHLGNSARLDAAGPVQLAGYRIDAYSPAAALVSVVLKGARGKLVVFATPLVWTAGDWKYVFPPAGAPALEVIDDLSGYVPWSAF
jgi:hypothetical protein